MNTLLKWGLIIGATGYLLKDQIAAAIHLNAPATTAPEPGPATAPPAATTATTRELLQQWAETTPQYHEQGNLLNFHQWSYGYNAVRGQQPPAPETLGANDGTRLMTIDEFLPVIAKVGLTGFRRRSIAAHAWGVR